MMHPFAAWRLFLMGTFLSLAPLGLVVLLDFEPTAGAVGYCLSMRRRHPDAVADEVLTPASLKTQRRQDRRKTAFTVPPLRLCVYQ